MSLSVLDCCFQIVYSNKAMQIDNIDFTELKNFTKLKLKTSLICAIVTLIHF